MSGAGEGRASRAVLRRACFTAELRGRASGGVDQRSDVVEGLHRRQGGGTDVVEGVGASSDGIRVVDEDAGVCLDVGDVGGFVEAEQGEGSAQAGVFAGVGGDDLDDDAGSAGGVDESLKLCPYDVWVADVPAECGRVDGEPTVALVRTCCRWKTASTAEFSWSGGTRSSCAARTDRA